MPRYRLCGLDVDCPEPLAVPAIVADGAVSAPSEVTISLGAVPPDLDRPRLRGPTWQAGAERLLITVPGLGRLLVCGQDRIEVEPASPGAWAELAPVLTGAPLAALLLRRARVPLRAAAVVVAGQVQVLCGPAGCGKSAFAAALVDAGAEPWADDLTALDLVDDRVWAAAEIGGAAPLPVAAIHMLVEESAQVPPGSCLTLPAPLAVHGMMERLYRRGLAEAVADAGLLARVAVMCDRVAVTVLANPAEDVRRALLATALVAQWRLLGGLR